MNLYSRMLAAGGLAVLAGLGAVPAQAQAPAYPTRSITMIVPFAAGGPTDVIARIVSGHMQQTLGQSIIIENVVGAGGTTATTRAARAARGSVSAPRPGPISRKSSPGAGAITRTSLSTEAGRRKCWPSRRGMSERS